MSSDLNSFSANLVWSRSPTQILEIYNAPSGVYFKWVISYVDGEWHLHVSDAWGNLTEMGKYSSFDQAATHAEHFELWEHQMKSHFKSLRDPIPTGW